MSGRSRTLRARNTRGQQRPRGDIQASARPACLQRPMSNPRSATTSNAKPVPVLNSSTRTPRSTPSSSVTSLTPATWPSRPTRRSSSARERPGSVRLTVGENLTLPETVDARHQCIVHPPSIRMVWPVMNEEPSPARKTARLPMSSGLPDERRRYTTSDKVTSIRLSPTSSCDWYTRVASAKPGMAHVVLIWRAVCQGSSPRWPVGDRGGGCSGRRRALWRRSCAVSLIMRGVGYPSALFRRRRALSRSGRGRLAGCP